MHRQSKRLGATNKQRAQSAVVIKCVPEIAREIAEKETARIPWRRLLKARRQYVRWEAYLLWVRAIEGAEGHFPEWLAEIVDQRARGFLRFAAEYEFDIPERKPALASGGSCRNGSASGFSQTRGARVG